MEIMCIFNEGNSNKGPVDLGPMPGPESFTGPVTPVSLPERGVPAADLVVGTGPVNIPPGAFDPSWGASAAAFAGTNFGANTPIGGQDFNINFNPAAAAGLGWFPGQMPMAGWFPGWGEGFGQQAWNQPGLNQLWGPDWGQGWAQQAWGAGNIMQQGFNQQFANQNFPVGGALPNLAANLNSAENFQARFVGNAGTATAAAAAAPVSAGLADNITPIFPGTGSASQLTAF